MSNNVTIFQILKARCAQKGTNLSAICRAAGVHRQTVERWKDKTPKTLTTLEKLENAIENYGK